MSYILDALKKSQQERELGQVPNLFSQQAARQRRRKLWLMMLLGMLVAFIAGAAVLYTLLPKLLPQEIPAETVSQAQPPTNTAVANNEQPAATAGQTTTQAEQPVRPAPTQPLPTAKLPPKPAPVAVTVPDTAQADEDVPDENLTDRQAEIAAMKKRAQEMKSKPLPQTAINQPAPARSEAPVKKLDLADLPPDLRAKVPSLNVLMIYADPDPSRSFAIVNGSKMRQGDSTIEGVRLEQIQAEGLLMSVGGQEFWKGR